MQYVVLVHHHDSLSKRKCNEDTTWGHQQTRNRLDTSGNFTVRRVPHAGWLVQACGIKATTRGWSSCRIIGNDADGGRRRRSETQKDDDTHTVHTPLSTFEPTGDRGTSNVVHGNPPRGQLSADQGKPGHGTVEGRRSGLQKATNLGYGTVNYTSSKFPLPRSLPPGIQRRARTASPGIRESHPKFSRRCTAL